MTRALQALRDGAKPDAIVFDITMPDEDGIALLKQLRNGKLAPAAKLIAVTNADGERERAEELGIARIVVKATMIPSEVVQMVKEELGKR